MSDEELVRLSGEMVMGWRIHCRNTAHWVDARLEHSAGAPDYVVRASAGVWNPLLNLQDAWMLVEAMRAKDKYVRVEVQPSGMASVNIWRHGVVVDERADTAPRAIVLAALRAVGVEA